MRGSEKVVDWLERHDGWGGDKFCICCREYLLMDITPIGFDPETGDQMHHRRGRCPRAKWAFSPHTTDGAIIPPRPKVYG